MAASTCSRPDWRTRSTTSGTETPSPSAPATSPPTARRIARRPPSCRPTRRPHDERSKDSWNRGARRPGAPVVWGRIRAGQGTPAAQARGPPRGGAQRGDWPVRRRDDARGEGREGSGEDRSEAGAGNLISSQTRVAPQESPGELGSGTGEGGAGTESPHPAPGGEARRRAQGRQCVLERGGGGPEEGRQGPIGTHLRSVRCPGRGAVEGLGRADGDRGPPGVP